MGGQINSIWTIVISSIFVYILYNIWIQRGELKNERKNIGIKYFSIALLFWLISGLNSVCYYAFIETTNQVNSTIAYQIFRTLLSIGNSAFFLLAIPSIEVEKVPTKDILRKEKKNVGTYSILVLFGTLAWAAYIYFIALEGAGNQKVTPEIKRSIYFVGILDLLFAFIVIWELIIRMVQAFKERKMEFMIPISWFLIIGILVAQLSDVAPILGWSVLDDKFYMLYRPAILLIYKTLLILLFLILLYSWELKKNKKQLAELNIAVERVNNDYGKKIVELKEKTKEFEREANAEKQKKFTLIKALEASKSELNKKILEADALGTELKGVKEIQTMRNKNGNNFLASDGNDTYLKFYKEDKALIVELTVLKKGIIKAKIYSTQNREYKDLLKFAVYKKAGIEIKAVSGMHRDFGGDIYKSVSDIRKKFLNPKLKEYGFEEFNTNELIVQKIKGTGIYELDCIPEFIEIDQNSLKKLIEIEKILKPIES